MKKHNFSSGPSILPQEVFEKASQAVLNYNNTGLSILEISHRSDEFLQILSHAKQLVLELLQLDTKQYSVLFLQGGASMEFCRIPQNLLRKNGKAGYVNTGTWANNAFTEAQQFGEVIEIASTKNLQYNSLPKFFDIPDNLDYVHFTSNNTIYGTQFKTFPKTNIPLVCDMSSDIFSRNLDFSQFDLIYAGAQKNIGPSGTTLIVVKNSILGKTGRKISSIMDYQKHIEKKSMFNTPAVFPIYVSLLTMQWLKNMGGIQAIETINIQKANLLYQEIDRNPLLRGTANKDDRSLMNVTFVLNNSNYENIFDKLCLEANISGIKGHRTVGGYRASIYNAMPIESVQALVDVMQKLEQNI